MLMDTLQAHELFAAIVLVIVTVLLFRHLRRLDAPRTSSSSLPRPRGLPLIGNLHQLGRLPHVSLAALTAKHEAPLMLLRLGSVPTLVVSTADAARALFQPNDRALSGRPVQSPAATLSYGLQDITFSAPDNPLWRAARRACLSELLGAPRVRGFRDAREAEAAALIADIADTSSAGSPVNLSEKLLSSSNRIVMRVAFGGYDEETTALLEESPKQFGTFFVSDYLPWLEWVDALRGVRRRLQRYFHELDAFYERLIHDRLSKQAGSKDKEDVLDVLLRLHQDPAHKTTFGNRGAVKGILLDIFLAGTETSAATLEWTMTELIRHPDVLRKAQSEVRNAVDGGKDMVREADLPQLLYLKSVIRESLRLHPPAALVPRETIEAFTVRGGYEVPAGTQVIVNAKAIGTDPDAWGPDAARFVPERHLREGVDLDDHKPWRESFAFVPFGMGRRSCPGVHFGTAVVELVLANLLFSFDWRALGEVDMEEAPGLIVPRKNPLVLVAERRCMK